jgi:hypothetical protein
MAGSGTTLFLPLISSNGLTPNYPWNRRKATIEEKWPIGTVTGTELEKSA